MLFQAIRSHRLTESYDHALFRAIVTALEQAKHQVAATNLTLRYGPFHVGLPAGIFGAGPKRRFQALNRVEKSPIQGLGAL